MTDDEGIQPWDESLLLHKLSNIYYFPVLLWDLKGSSNEGACNLFGETRQMLIFMLEAQCMDLY